MQQIAQAFWVGRGGFGDEASGVGEVDVGLLRDAREVEAGVVAVAGEPVAGAATVWGDEAEHAFAEAAAFDVALDGGGGVVGQRVGARKKKDTRRAGDVVERPEFRVAGDEVEAFAERADVGEQVVADQAHDFPERFAGGKLGCEGEAAEERAVDGRVELAHDVALHAEPACGVVGAAAVEPLGGLEPVAELAGVLVEPEVLEDERERAGGDVVARKLVVVEVVERGVVNVADIDDGDGRIGEIGGGGFAADDGRGVFGEEDAAGEKLVLMRAAGVGENRGEGRHESAQARADVRVSERDRVVSRCVRRTRPVPVRIVPSVEKQCRN